MDDKKYVTLQENEQVTESLYKYLQSLNICVEMRMEYISANLSCMQFKPISTAYKTRTNIIGGYDAELPFAIYYQAKEVDTQKPLNILGSMFEMETHNGFPNLQLNGYTPEKLEMISTPAIDLEKESNMAVFTAMYKLTYKKKAR